ncbi:hypothetical protein Ga0123461_0748 [Mariprofundus aestuarium]|uniref:Uncharacterized protein n=1 Tax=Mariprofundus aestuarium TaxID=1921086 RepID=A0A2K8KWW2_MARES|nr:hypothetical protein Ga0123461_0748 [Mariprofundus aestuarium]
MKKLLKEHLWDDAFILVIAICMAAWFAGIVLYSAS